MAEEAISQIASKEMIKALVSGKLPREAVEKLLRMPTKDGDRFWKYLEVLQEGVPWKDKILLRISEHLYIVRKEDKGRVVKCDCGQEFGDYRVNWKFSSLIYVRKTLEEFSEIYTTPCKPDPDFVEIREFYCPGCLAQLGVEVATHGYPIVFEMLPNLDVFYRDWLGQPLEDERPDWFQDQTLSRAASWAKEV